MRVAILGTGAMGSRMAAALLRAGHSVTAWNRTSSRAEPLKSQGATIARSPAEAAAGAELVLSMVRDDEASRQVWLSSSDGALGAMKGDAVGIESSTLSLRWIGELASTFANRGIAFLDVPVVGTRPQAEAATLIALVGGEASTLERARPALAALGSNIHHVGPAGSGAALKLVINAFLGIQVAAVAELLGAAQRLGIDRKRAAEILVELPSCSAAAKGATLSMLAHNFAPAFPVELLEKDLGYLAREAPASAAPLTAAARDVFNRAIEAGHATENMTAVATLYE